MRGNIMKQFRSSHPGRDLLSGIIVALVSIPISMGYAQIAGLPVVYGLYGSLLPILAFSLITTSPQFVVGVDAMPAVMVGSLLAQFGIAAESDAAMQLVPLMSILTALWFLVFFLLKAGRIVKYISTPVMGDSSPAWASRLFSCRCQSCSAAPLAPASCLRCCPTLQGSSPPSICFRRCWASAHLR